MISSTRLCLKPFTSDDADECYACITPTLTKYMSWDPPQDRNAFENIWQTWLITIQDESDWVFVIRDQLNDEFLVFIKQSSLDLS